MESSTPSRALDFPTLVETPEIVAHYRATEGKLGLVILAALLPFWGIWAPYVASWLLRAVIQGGLPGYFDLFWLAMLFLSLGVAALTGIYACLDDKLIFTAEGITFPFRFINTLGWKRTRGWNELNAIEFRREGEGICRYPTCANLKFKSGSVPLSIRAIKDQDLRELILTLDAYAPHVTYQPPRTEVQLNVQNISGGKSLSFTRLWEEDLGSRFASTAFVPLEPGSTLQDGRITIVGQMAFGGLSAIYLAKFKDGRLVVVKEATVPANADNDTKEKALQMFQREAQFLVALNHPRIARVFDHLVENGRNYLLLEHIDGLDLRQVVRDSGRQPEEFVLRWGIQIAEIVAYLHCQSPPIVHRDVTPDNLVLAKDGSITLIDFGAANEFVGTATGTLVGKQSYISPEQFRGKARTESDIYSLGCTLYFLLTAEDPEPLCVSHPREKNPLVSIELDQIVAHCTEEELPDRFSKIEDVGQALMEFRSKVTGKQTV